MLGSALVIRIYEESCAGGCSVGKVLINDMGGLYDTVDLKLRKEEYIQKHEKE